MEQRARTASGPPAGVPERRVRRGTAPIAHDRIPFYRPELPPVAAITEYFEESVEHGSFANGGPCARRLEARIEARLSDHAHCVLVSSSTAGLIAALRAVCGVPTSRRRFVACPSYTHSGTACAIVWAGFQPLFVDIEPAGFGLDADWLDAALRARRGRVAGILACSPFGTAPSTAQRAAWRSIAACYAVPLLVDSAAGFGAVDETGLPLGAQGDTEIFSFHATRPFAIGEGGAVVTPDPHIAATVGRLVNFGLEPSTYLSTAAGFNGKLSDLQAAAGLAALDAIDEVLAGRRTLARRIQRAIEPVPVTYQRGAVLSTWPHFQALAPDRDARERVLAAAAAGAVDARTLHDPPLHRHPAFAGAEVHGELAMTEAIAARSVSLPLANRLDDDEVSRIAAVMRACAGKG